MKSLLAAVFCLITLYPAEASPVPDTTGGKGFFYRGTEFTKIFTAQSGTPFLNVEGPVTGWVNYYGSRYEAVKIQYDIEDDQLVSYDITGSIRMQLVKEKISAFGYGGKEFIRHPEAGLFFEKIYEGHHQVLIRWQKVFIRTGTEDGKFKLYKGFFIWNGKELMAIQNNQELFSYFGKNSKQIRDYFREQGLSMKKDPDKALVEVVRYADKNGLHEL